MEVNQGPFIASSVNLGRRRISERIALFALASLCAGFCLLHVGCAKDEFFSVTGSIAFPANTGKDPLPVYSDQISQVDIGCPMLPLSKAPSHGIVASMDFETSPAEGGAAGYRHASERARQLGADSLLYLGSGSGERAVRVIDSWNTYGYYYHSKIVSNGMTEWKYEALITLERVKADLAAHPELSRMRDRHNGVTEGATLLHFAVIDGTYSDWPGRAMPKDDPTYDRKGLIGALLGAGADINAADKLGETPLHWAARNGNVEGALLLLSCGAKIDARDKDGCTPLMIAMIENFSDKQDEVAKLLRSRGALIDESDYAKVRRWQLIKTPTASAASQASVPDRNK